LLADGDAIEDGTMEDDAIKDDAIEVRVQFQCTKTTLTYTSPTGQWQDFFQ
jgi:hypothetical protein